MVSDTGRFVPESEVLNPELVDCEWGYSGCMKAGYPWEMHRHSDGWICWPCYATAEQEYHESRGGW